jgi:predicted RND superfamily exporter protein
MKMITRAIGKYSHFVSHHPYPILAVVIIVSIAAVIGSSMVGTKFLETRDIIPERLEVIQGFNLFIDSFGSDDTLMIAIELDPTYTGSNEPRDIRDPEVISFINLLTASVDAHERVESASSISSLIKDLNQGSLPQSKRDIVNLVADNPFAEQFISQDYDMAIINMRLVDVDNQDDLFEVVNDMIVIIEQLPKPAGLDVNIAGELAVGPVVNDLVAPDIENTMSAAFLGIIIISFLLFFSIRYGATPIAVILFGILWATGYLGFIGLGLSAETSGTMSMIMGIGIDFGIQMTTRFRDERKKLEARLAMEKTMNAVFVPMLTTTLAALIGFSAMSWGQLTFFGEFGTILSYGVTASFLAGITIVPVILVLGDGISVRFGRKFGRFRKRLRKRRNASKTKKEVIK